MKTNEQPLYLYNNKYYYPQGYQYEYKNYYNQINNNPKIEKIPKENNIKIEPIRKEKNQLNLIFNSIKDIRLPKNYYDLSYDNINNK